MNYGFLRVFRDSLTTLERKIENEAEKAQFQRAMNAAVSTIDGIKIEGRSFVVFADANGLLWKRQFPLPISDLTRWRNGPYIHPLARILDEFEPYGVILVDRTRARLLSVILDEVYTRKELAVAEVPSRTKTAGTDPIRSQGRFQKSADDHTARHLHNVAETAVKLFAREGIRRVVVGGSEQTALHVAAELEDTKAFDAIRTGAGSIDGDDRKILKETAPIAEALERASELDQVSQMLNTSAKGGRAAVGIENTLASINKMEIYELIYADDLQLWGFECHSCGALLVNSTRHCPYCEGSLQADAEMIERAVEKSLSMGAHIEVVRGDAARQLMKQGGVGARLRTGA